MAFMQEVTIHESKKVRVYINQCHNKGKKTYYYTVRKDDSTGLAEVLGVIRFSGRWWQYVFEPKENTFWSAGCMQGIVKFLEKINKKWREKKTIQNA